MFRGRYEHSVDGKGRVALPAAFRRHLTEGAQLVITTHLSAPCLVAYPEEAWAAFEAKVAALPQFDEGVMALRRLYVGSAMDCPVDRQGRLLLPQVLRAHARIEKEAFWVGGIQTMEIWGKETWSEVVEPQRASVGPAVLQKLGELGL